MGVGGKGPKELGGLEARLKKISSSNAFRSKVMKNLSMETLHLVSECFIHQRDPYGRPWAPVNFEGRRVGGQILRDTGRLMNGFRATSNAQTFHVTNRTVYAAIHQYGGTVHHAARTELRRYTSGNTRRRLKLNSKAVRSVRTVASYGASRSQIPARPFLPDAKRLPPKWKLSFATITNHILESELKKGPG